MMWAIGKRYEFTATFGGVSAEGYAILLDVQSTDGIPFKNHVWLPYGKKFKQLEPETPITFTAKVNYYSHYKAKRLTLTNLTLAGLP